MRAIDSFKSAYGFGYFGSSARSNLKIETAMTEVINEYTEEEAQLYLDSRCARHDSDYFEYQLENNPKMKLSELKEIIRIHINKSLPLLKEEC